MCIQRVDELAHPPVIGETYLVPGVVHVNNWSYKKETGWVPVIGLKHWDKDFDPAILPHIHPDLRFVSEEKWKQMDDGFSQLKAVRLNDIIGEITYQERVCLRAFPDSKIWREIWETAVGKMSKEYQTLMTTAPAIKGPKGWICPHKGARLGSANVDKDGVITCPLHGLKFCSKTGKNVTLEVDKK